MINPGDTVFVLFSAALVMLMTLGLALFYGGLVRAKNVLSIIMQCLILACALSLQWILFGYSLAFGPDVGGGIIGGLQWLGLHSVGVKPYAAYSSTIPHQAFMIFQCMFAAITPALIIGAFAERIKFSGFFIFSLLWAIFVYDPLAHWIWGQGGWLKALGTLDFAGGMVVHLSAGAAALVLCVLMGKREGYPHHAFTPHNLPMTYLGLTLLWFGWFGFNAGSALAANGVATSAFVATNTSAAAAGLTWALIEWIINKAPTSLGTATGVVAGLATITPAAGFVSPLSAMLIGISAGIVCYFMVAVVKQKFGYDDSLDVFGVHGIGGLLGTFCVGIFASKAINAGGANGILYGGVHLLTAQIIGIVATFAYSVAATIVLYKVVDALVGMRVSKEDEVTGLDLTQHKEAAYGD
jgi:Amt family ammonium transporter